MGGQEICAHAITHILLLLLYRCVYVLLSCMSGCYLCCPISGVATLLTDRREISFTCHQTDNPLVSRSCLWQYLHVRI